MNELEWLKQQSGLTDDELKAWEAVLGDTKFKGFLKKIMVAEQSEGAARKKAETELQQFTDRYNNEFVPAMRDVTSQSIASSGEVASLRAKLEKAKEFGIVLEDEDKTVKPGAKVEPRAPGSPDPNLVTRDDFGRFSQGQANTIIALNDLNAEHFATFGAPLPNTQELVNEVTRQHQLGNKSFTLRRAWEEKHNVVAKRAELDAAKQKKHDDEIREATRKEERERAGSNPNVRGASTSRFSTYTPSEASSDKKPWQAPRKPRERNAGWREHARTKLREATAA